MSDPKRLSEQDLDELLNIEWLNYYDMKDTKTTVEEMAAAIRQLRAERDMLAKSRSRPVSDPLDLRAIEGLAQQRLTEPQGASTAWAEQTLELVAELRATRAALYDLAHAHNEGYGYPCSCPSHQNTATVLARVSDDVRSPHEAP